MNNDELNRRNFAARLNAFLQDNNIHPREAARAITCPEAVIWRTALIERHCPNATNPTDELLKRVAVMMSVGFQRYCTLSAAEKERISEALGAVGGGAVGFGMITTTICTLGIPGLSAAGIATALATLGAPAAVIAGPMVTGIAIAACFPLIGILVGIGLIGWTKTCAEEAHLSSHQDDLDAYWEIVF